MTGSVAHEAIETAELKTVFDAYAAVTNLSAFAKVTFVGGAVTVVVECVTAFRRFGEILSTLVGAAHTGGSSNAANTYAAGCARFARIGAEHRATTDLETPDSCFTHIALSAEIGVNVVGARCGDLNEVA